MARISVGLRDMCLETLSGYLTTERALGNLGSLLVLIPFRDSFIKTLLLLWGASLGQDWAGASVLNAQTPHASKADEKFINARLGGEAREEGMVSFRASPNCRMAPHRKQLWHWEMPPLLTNNKNPLHPCIF